VKFVARGGGYALFLTDRAAVLSLTKDGVGSHGHRGSAADAVAADTGAKSDVIRMELVGAAAGLKVSGAEPLAGKANYLIGNDQSKWHTDVATFARVKYAGVYPGVDLVYYGNQRQLEYDFVVEPGASARQVRVRFDGARRLRVGADGNLRIVARKGEIAFQKPVVYQMRDGRRELVDGRFVLKGKNEVGFTVGNYDAARELVIDPVLAYSTYLGGSGGDFAAGIAVDAEGNAYIVGTTASTDFPLKGTPYQATNKGAANGLTNIFVTKMNLVGSGLVYSTYIGGSGLTSGASPYGTYGGDTAAGVVIDAQGSAYIVGTTYSSDFPVTSGALQKVNKGVTLGVTNAFAAKLNATGSALIYSTYLGGSGALPFENGASPAGDGGTAIAADGAGNAYVTGGTYSADFPVTSGAFQKVNNAIGESSDNAFVSKMNATGTALIYSTYLGGSASGPTFLTNTNSDGDSGLAIAVDTAGNAYVGGLAFSTDFPVTEGAFQATNSAGPIAESNAFVTKLNPKGSALVYSTYFGGSGNYSQGPLPFADEVNAIAIDPAGDAYIAGATNSSYDFPVSLGAFQIYNFGAAQGFSNAFVSELNPSGSGMVSSTLLGGTGGDGATGIAVDAAGNAYLAGYAGSTDFPLTSNAFQNFGGGAFVAEVPHGSTYLLYSTYLGAGTAAGIALDPAGNAYVTGTAGPGFPTIRDAFQHKSYGGTDAFVAKFAVNSTEVPTAMTLGANIDPQIQGHSVTFTAQVTALAGGGEPTGIVNFESGGGVYSKDLDSTGRASFAMPFASSGTYGVAAFYLGDGTFAPSSAGYLETVLSTGVGLSFVSGDNQRTGYGMTFANPLVFEVTEGGLPRAGIPVTFASSDMRLSSLRAVSGANGEVTITATPLAVGNLSGTASLMTTGEAFSITFAEAANPGLLTVTAKSESVAQGKPIPVLSYSITGFLNGDKATVVSGAPTLSTVAEGTAEGSYPITVAMGTLAATNYKFKLVNGTLTITSAGTVAKPVFTPNGNVFTAPVKVMMMDATPGALIYYTTDGTTPTAKSTLYTGPITVTSTEVIEAIGVASGYANSAVTAQNYRVQ
jgi:hypothetical protein